MDSLGNTFLACGCADRSRCYLGRHGSSLQRHRCSGRRVVSVFAVLVSTGLALTTSIVGALTWYGWSKETDFPILCEDELLFDEKNAGGCSLLSWHTRRFVNKNNLWISIARGQLWIRPKFLASVAIGFQLDQVHQIPLDLIVEAVVNENEFDITYSDADGIPRTVRLWLKKPNEFQAELVSGYEAAATEDDASTESFNRASD